MHAISFKMVTAVFVMQFTWNYLFVCVPFMFDVLILYSTGGLRGLEECHKVAIQEAIDQKCWGTADFLLDQALTGKPHPLAHN